MISFEKTTFDNYQKLSKYFAKNIHRFSNYGIVSTYMWQEYFDYRYAIVDDALVMYGYDPETKQPYYCYPMGDGDLHEAVLKLLAELPRPYYLGLVPESEVDWLRSVTGVEAFEAREEEDYLYQAEDLALLQGKKYHTQRNHINSFKTAHTYVCEMLTADSAPSIIPFLDRIERLHPDSPGTYFAERRALKNLVNDWTRLPVVGARLMVDGNIVAVTIGEVLGDQLIVHSEKADRDYRGAYPLINQDFVAHFYQGGAGITYVNREDDLGLEGLRKSKQEYHPVKMIKKYLFYMDK